MTLQAIRRWYADDLRLRTPVLRNPSVVEAFATVPRERFLGPGPWTIVPFNRPDEPFTTPDDAPHWLYHDVLVAIDPARALNNGQPSFWAHNFEHLDLRRGERVLQIGAGTGYYSAILAEIVGPAGRVTAVEFDADLAARARAALAPWRHVEVVAGDGRAARCRRGGCRRGLRRLDPPRPALARSPRRQRPPDDAAHRRRTAGASCCARPGGAAHSQPRASAGSASFPAPAAAIPRRRNASRRRSRQRAAARPRDLPIRALHRGEPARRGVAHGLVSRARASGSNASPTARAEPMIDPLRRRR